PLLIMSDCISASGRWGRILAIDPRTLIVEKTIYTPPTRMQPQNCDGSGGKNNNGCGQSFSAASASSFGTSCNGTCPGTCPSAIALEPPVAGKNRTALLGIETHILRVDFETGEATKVAETSGVPLRILPEDPSHALILVSMDHATFDNLGSNA